MSSRQEVQGSSVTFIKFEKSKIITRKNSQAITTSPELPMNRLVSKVLGYFLRMSSYY